MSWPEGPHTALRKGHFSCCLHSPCSFSQNTLLPPSPSMASSPARVPSSLSGICTPSCTTRRHSPPIPPCPPALGLTATTAFYLRLSLCVCAAHLLSGLRASSSLCSLPVSPAAPVAPGWSLVQSVLSDCPERGGAQAHVFSGVPLSLFFLLPRPSYRERRSPGHTRAAPAANRSSFPPSVVAATQSDSYSFCL